MWTAQKVKMISWRRRNPDTGAHHLLCDEASRRNKAMGHVRTFLIAAPVALGLLAAPAAHAEWRGHGGWDHRSAGWGGYRGGYSHGGNGGAIAGALLGLGAAAVIGGIIASQPPPAVAYAPQPGYYYYPTPGYPAPYYAQP